MQLTQNKHWRYWIPLSIVRSSLTYACNHWISELSNDLTDKMTVGLYPAVYIGHGSQRATCEYRIWELKYYYYVIEEFCSDDLFAKEAAFQYDFLAQSLHLKLQWNKLG